MLTSQPYAKMASGKSDALAVQERGKCTIDSSLKRKFKVSFI